MKLKDVYFIAILTVISLFIFLPFTNPIFVRLTTNHPYIMGFIKTMVLASMGEMLVNRMKTSYYTKEPGLILKAIIWGFLGMSFVFVFPLFDLGIHALFKNQIIVEHVFLNELFYALSVSIAMNLIFAPTFMMFHRITDTYILLAKGNIMKIRHIKFSDVINHIDFHFFFSFAILKTIPFFWIPAHTITFILPSTYRVLMASYLSIALGILLSVHKKR